jgi:hypothetical protein
LPERLVGLIMRERRVGWAVPAAIPQELRLRGNFSPGAEAEVSLEVCEILALILLYLLAVMLESADSLST